MNNDLKSELELCDAALSVSSNWHITNGDLFVAADKIPEENDWYWITGDMTKEDDGYSGAVSDEEYRGSKEVIQTHCRFIAHFSPKRVRELLERITSLEDSLASMVRIDKDRNRIENILNAQVYELKQYLKKEIDDKEMLQSRLDAAIGKIEELELDLNDSKITTKSHMERANNNQSRLDKQAKEIAVMKEASGLLIEQLISEEIIYRKQDEAFCDAFLIKLHKVIARYRLALSKLTDEDDKTALKIQKNNGQVRCPKCGSLNVAIERRPDGDAVCIECQHKDKYGNFLLKLTDEGDTK